MTLALVVVAIVFGLLALVAWAFAWRTLEEFADAEDLIEQLRHELRIGEPYVLLHEETFDALSRYVRRTPRRRGQL